MRQQSRQRGPWGAVGAAAVLLAMLSMSAAAPAAVPAPAAARPAPAAPAPRQTPPQPTAEERYATRLPTARFGSVTVYIPEGEPTSVAIFVSGDGGWQLGVIDMAHALVRLGAVVIGVDIRHYFLHLRRAAERAGAPCQSLAVDFEALSHEVQREIGLAEYHVPALIGYSSGATLVYAALVQSPPGTFAGALSLGFCPAQDFVGAALCPGAGLHYTHAPQHELLLEAATTLREPWIALQGEQDEVCRPQVTGEFAARVQGGEVVKLPQVGHGFGVQRNWLPQFRAAYAQLLARVETPPERAPDIGDLPVVEVQARATTEEFALLLTGDGGWAGLDRELAARLTANGVPTVGLNSLKYFWTQRTASETARDVARVLRHYFAAWHKQRVLLIGYSFGADVLPFVVNRLPPELRARIASVSLLGLDAHASFEIRISEWVGEGDGGPPTQPEIDIARVPTLCIYGEGDEETICPRLKAAGVVREQVGRGHHFSGEYATLADRILAFARTVRPVT